MRADCDTGNIMLGTDEVGASKLHVKTDTGAANTAFVATFENTRTSVNQGVVKVKAGMDVDDGNEVTNSTLVFISFQDEENNILGKVEGGGGEEVSFDASPSDKRLKQNIRPVKDIGIKDLLKIEVTEFNWKEGINKNSEKKHVGFIAQDLQKIYPRAVRGEESDPNLDPKIVAKDPLTVTKTKLIPLLVKSTQDLQEQINNLEKRIKKLEDK